MDYLINSSNFNNKSLIDVEEMYRYAVIKIFDDNFINKKLTIKNLRVYDPVKKIPSFITLIKDDDNNKHLYYLTYRDDDGKIATGTLKNNREVTKYIKKKEFDEERYNKFFGD